MTPTMADRLSDDEPYVIRKHGSFYRPDRAGYTNHVEAAGIYTQQEAEAEARVEPENIFAVRLRHYEPELRRNRDMTQAALDRLNPSAAALASPPPSAEWKMVPIEPTEAMWSAGLEAIKDGLTINDDAERTVRHAYRAMLAVVPIPPSNDQEPLSICQVGFLASRGSLAASPPSAEEK